MPKHWEPEFRNLPWDMFFQNPLTQECCWALQFQGKVTSTALRRAISMLELLVPVWEADEAEAKTRDLKLALQDVRPLAIGF